MTPRGVASSPGVIAFDPGQAAAAEFNQALETDTMTDETTALFEKHADQDFIRDMLARHACVRRRALEGFEVEALTGTPLGV